MKKINRFLLYIIASIALPFSVVAQDFMYVNENNKVQSSPPAKSFQYVKEVTLTNGFNVKGSDGPWYAKPADLVNAPQSSDRNYVRVETIFKPGGVTTEAEITNLPVTEKSTSFSYVDGLGRSTQEVGVKASPAKFDLVNFRVYQNPYGRELNTYLPYVSPSFNGSFKNSAIAEQEKFYKGTTGVAVDDRPYSINEFDSSPLNQINKTISPGLSWHTDAENKGVKSNFKLNAAGEITILNYVEGGVPTVAGTYEVNTLQISESADESGQIKRSYTNFRGQVILERIGDGTIWHDTYNVYDYAGNLVCVFPPEASSRFTEYSASSAKQLFLDTWTFQYKYDEHSRVIGKRIPGYVPGSEGWSSIIYDVWDRVVLTQEPNQYSTNQWTYTKYDIHNRPIMVGLTAGSKSTLQNSASTSTVHHESRLNNSIGYTNNAFPSHSESSLISISYYDDYDFKAYSGWDNEGFTYTAYNESGIVDITKLFTTAVRGYTTGSKVKILDQNVWLNTVTYYDKKYNVVQTIAENQLGGLDKVSTLYDEFTGKAKIAKRTHTTPGNSLSVTEEYTYDHSQRLRTITHQIDNTLPKVVMVSNHYNELGQLIEKNIHSTDNGANFLQSVDTRYNIRGWITHINNSSLTNDGINNDDVGDLFGMELLYNQSVIVNGGASTNDTNKTTKKMFDGNISAIKWKTDTKSAIPVERIYGFEYDAFKRFNSSYYATKNGTDWNGTAGWYNEIVNYYDKNGNIGSADANPPVGLTRYGLSNGSQSQIDNLTYRYAGNQLKNVKDDADAMGFKDKPGGSSIDEYSYDNSGNLIEDQNKSITNIIYNHLNRPKEIVITRADLSPVRTDKIKYTYDALGNKLSKEIEIGGSSVWMTQYVGAIQYDRSIPSSSYRISFLNTPEGRAVNNGAGYDYEYFLKDHQNNVRVVFGSIKQTESYRATMEVLSLDVKDHEESTFNNIPETRISAGSTSLNFTPPSENTLVPDRSARCNANLGQAIGPAKSLRILAGDAVYMEAFGKYTQPTGSSAVILGSVLAAAVNGTFGVTSEMPALWNGINTNAAAAAGSIPAGNVQPKAYLAFLFFDDNYVFQPSGSGAVGITTSAYNAFEKLSRSFTADRDGYLYIYLASESNVTTADVYFDEFYIVHQKNNTALQVVQASDYYPYGLSFNEYQSERLTTVSPGVYQPTLRNRYLFQGQELQNDLDLGWYHYKYRMHDAAIGRFGGVDPLAENYIYNSTYAFSENRLVDGIELEGAEYVNSSSIAPMPVLTPQFIPFAPGAGGCNCSGEFGFADWQYLQRLSKGITGRTYFDEYASYLFDNLIYGFDKFTPYRSLVQQIEAEKKLSPETADRIKGLITVENDGQKYSNYITIRDYKMTHYGYNVGQPLVYTGMTTNSGSRYPESAMEKQFFEPIADNVNKGTSHGIEQIIIELNNGGKPYPKHSNTLDNVKNSTSPFRAEYYTRKLEGYLYLYQNIPNWQERFYRPPQDIQGLINSIRLPLK